MKTITMKSQLMIFCFLLTICLPLSLQDCFSQQWGLPVLAGMSYPKALVYDTSIVSKELYNNLFESLEVEESITIEVLHAVDANSINERNLFIEQTNKELLNTVQNEKDAVDKWNKEDRLIKPERPFHNPSNREQPIDSPLGTSISGGVAIPSSKQKYISYETPQYEKVTIMVKKIAKANGEITLIILPIYYDWKDFKK